MAGRWKNDRSGIYLIVNRDTGQFYLGSTVAFRSREYRHMDDLAKGVHRNPHLQNAYIKYGRAAFEFRIVAFIDVESLLQVEQLCLDQLWDDGDRCYNIARYADAPSRGRAQSAEHRLKLSEAQRGKRKGPRGPQKRPRSSWYVDSSETKAKRRASLLKTARNAKTFDVVLVDPSGARHGPIHNMTSFAREHGLRASLLYQVITGKRAVHLGWTRSVP